MRRTRILLAEDHAIVAEGLKSLLSGMFDLVGKVGDGLALIKAAKQLKPDIIITDISMPHLSGLDAASQLKKEGLSSKIIFLTMHPDLHYAKEALRLGASAYLLKQEAGDELFLAIDQVLEGKIYISPLIKKDLLNVMQDMPRQKQLENQPQEKIGSIVENQIQQQGFALIKSRSVAMEETIRAAKKVAYGDVSQILLTGETGTGKDLMAQAIHYTSRRASSNFVMINCPSVPETLFESELFGHEQGAFTDAKKNRPGRLEMARGGTLFLDE